MTTTTFLYVGVSPPRDEGGPATVGWLAGWPCEWAPLTRLDQRHDLRNHSPDGFQWGYGGSGPSQLALALCAHALRSRVVPDDWGEADRQAQAVYQEFKRAVIAAIDTETWSMTSVDVLAIVDAMAAPDVDDFKPSRVVGMLNAHAPAPIAVALARSLTWRDGPQSTRRR